MKCDACLEVPPTGGNGLIHFGQRVEALGCGLERQSAGFSGASFRILRKDGQDAIPHHLHNLTAAPHDGRYYAIEIVIERLDLLKRRTMLT
jgi:hypothetical protein